MSAPGQVTGISISQGIPAYNQITWSAVAASPDVTNYQIYATIQPFWSSATLLATVDAATFTYNDTTAAFCGSTYYWVLAVNGDGSSPHGTSHNGYRAIPVVLAGGNPFDSRVFGAKI